MVRTRQLRSNRAKTLVEAELNCVKREEDAFQQFIDRLHDIKVTDQESVQSGNRGPTTLVIDGKPSEDVQTVRRAYRETVMSVSHYECEYGETLQTNMAAEIGPTIAGQIANGQTLTPTLCEALLKASKKCRSDRQNFHQLLRDERDSLHDIAAELNEIKSCIVDLNNRITECSHTRQLAHIDHELATLESRCTDLANVRQETIHDRTRKQLAGIDGISLAEYLYTDLETTTPVLSDVAHYLDLIQHLRMRCLR